MQKYYLAIHKCCERYRDMMREAEYPINNNLWLFNMETMFACRNESLSLMKLNRWLGYIQGCLIERGLTTIEEEREWTRPLFRPLDSN